MAILYSLIGSTDTGALLGPITGLFISAVLFVGTIRVLLIWFQSKLSHSIGSDISIKMFRKTLYQPFEAHFKRNSSEVIAGIANKVSTVVYQILLPIFTIFSSFIILISVLSLLFWIDTKIVL